ncbi:MULTISPECIES: electron transport complex subunit RsxE [unclassified Candidatus Frackibacter]|uniref:electron transport complex subunit RsxE n=1 Tax=unclassified Candidatus Frackibacter TaxID=2648818 RepID=UPI000798C165|nr:MULTISPECIES: electron transport complex subunit RsxE [unclassified Candidatus Frackibacter]KXS41327.1 MAG: Na+-transporting NADH:ubiquinone oxidoreductase subunit D [Candidatus Frackibacter sp. T328-2]SEM64880.1 Na+-transporting NADH:ubiquinone oxidoreductase subunit D [Candidatus Frackibacter sp. WG12]SFL67581.1 Na+-transporting NADH:ubiquinone oxidoreductase subunit D [Candidatus Frackibacter sp. WG13]
MLKKLYYKFKYTKPFALMYDGIWSENPVLLSALGICSALAVTNRVVNGIAMGLAVTFVVMVSSVLTSLIKKYIPNRVRIVTYVILISAFVVVVDQFFKAFYPSISRALGPYVALIITNCLIMGRAEAFATKNPAKFSIMDGFAHGMGYTIVLIIISVIREVLAFGTLMGVSVVGEGFTKWVVMAMAPGGFFLLAVLTWAVRERQIFEEEEGDTKNSRATLETSEDLLSEAA